MSQRPPQGEVPPELEERLRAATLDAAELLVVVLDPEGRILRFNPASERTTGLRAEEVLGKPVWDVIPEVDREGARAVFAELRRSGLPNVHENDWLARDGRRRRIAWSNTAVRGADGRVALVVGTGIDVTGLRASEGAREQSEARLRGLVVSAMDAIVSVDEAQRITLFNPAAEAMFGRRAEEVLGQPLDGLLPERFRAAHGGHVQRFGETGVTSRRMGRLGQVWGLRASGEEFPVEASISQMEMDGERLFTVILRDASQRERAAETARLLARMVESSEDAIVAKDLEGRILSWNPAAERIYGYRAEEVLGTPVTVLVPPEQVEEVAGHLAAIRQGISPEPFETTRLRKDGQRIQVVLRISPIRDAAGAVVGASCTARDVTARRRLERRLRDAEELASVGTLVAGLAHDIGTPLNVVLGYADLLERSLREEQNRERVRTIREQVKRVAKLIQTLLNLARPHDAVRAPVAIEALLHESLGFLGETLRRRGIAGERDFAGVGQVRGDRERLERAFLNLLLNAADAMRQGGKLRVSTRALGDEAIEVRVSDTGDGIAPELHERIFEPFYTTKAPGQGSGLGLLVTRSIVVDHGGTIEVQSDVGQGAEFRVVLPRSGAPEAHHSASP